MVLEQLLVLLVYFAVITLINIASQIVTMFLVVTSVIAVVMYTLKPRRTTVHRIDGTLFSPSNNTEA